MMTDLLPHKKTVAIVDCKYLPLSPDAECLGGSETWVIEIAKAFARNGWHVVVFANVRAPLIIGATEWYPLSLAGYRSDYQIFDIAIFSRGFIFSNTIRAHRRYLMFHDLGLACPVPPEDVCNLGRVDRFYVLSDYAKNFVLSHVLRAPLDRFFLTHNGIDYSLYSSKVEKEPSMVWSSCKERGFGFFVKYVLPDILTAVPDFTLHVCSYNDYKDEVYADVPAPLRQHMIFHGRLNKQELAVLQCRSKIWCYPNLGYSELDPSGEFGETFCITAVENLAAGNVIIAGDFGGLQTTLQGYPLLGTEYYVNGRVPSENLTEYGRFLATYCIKALRGEYAPVLRGDPDRYTWDAAYATFVS